MRIAVALVLLALPWPSPGARTPPQDKPPAFPAGVEMVTVDVVVLDHEGRPVPNLTAADFAVFENGRAQIVASFEAVRIAADAEVAIAPPEGGTKEAPRSSRGRTFVLFFDDYHLAPGEAHRARQALREVIQEAAPGDRLALAAPWAQAWTIVTMPEGREGMLDRLAALGGRDFPGGLTVTEEIYRDDLTVKAIEECLQALATEPGRKALFVLSAGLPYDSPVLAGRGNALYNHKRLIEASRQVNAAIYFADARGLAAAGEGRGPGSAHAFSMLDRAQQSSLLDAAASDTGGLTLRNFNDLRPALVRVANESRSYYLLGYRPSHTQKDRGFQRIEVRVKGKGWRVRARKGYYPAERS